ncbi:hypothetical protein IEE87_27135 (plasmid) [Klebsiella pneumoniae]|nr:hypothetical protein IEE87_27135 [Klebsiella pneumoniae]
MRVKVVKKIQMNEHGFFFIAVYFYLRWKTSKSTQNGKSKKKENKQANALKKMARRTKRYSLVSKRSVMIEKKNHFTKMSKRKKKNKNDSIEGKS